MKGSDHKSSKNKSIVKSNIKENVYVIEDDIVNASTRSRTKQQDLNLDLNELESKDGCI